MFDLEKSETYKRHVRGWAYCFIPAIRDVDIEGRKSEAREFSHIEELDVVQYKKSSKPELSDIVQIIKDRYKERYDPLSADGQAYVYRLDTSESSKPLSFCHSYTDAFEQGKSVESINKQNTLYEKNWQAFTHLIHYILKTHDIDTVNPNGRVADGEDCYSLDFGQVNALAKQSRKFQNIKMKNGKNLVQEIARQHGLKKSEFKWKEQMEMIQALMKKTTSQYDDHAILLIEPPTKFARRHNLETEADREKKHNQDIHQDGGIIQDYLRFQMTFTGLSSEFHAQSNRGMKRSNPGASEFEGDLNTTVLSYAGPILTAHDSVALHSAPYENQLNWRLKLLFDSKLN